MKRSRLGMPLTLTQDAWYIHGVCVEQVLWEYNKARSPKYPLTHLILCLDDEVLKAEFDRRDPAVWPIIEGKAKPLPQVDDFAYLGPITTILELDGAKNLLGSLGCPQSNRKWLEEVFCYLCVSFVPVFSFATLLTSLGLAFTPHRIGTAPNMKGPTVASGMPSWTQPSAAMEDLVSTGASRNPHRTADGYALRGVTA